MDKLSELYQKGVSRRNFLAGAGALGAASVIVGCSNDNGSTTTNPPPPPPAPSFTDADILNFALNLEYLEAEFYLHAATGQGLPASLTSGSGTAGNVTAPASTQLTGLTPTQAAILAEIAYDEQQHVVTLRKAITAAGAQPVARPAIDLTFFGPLAVAAKITTSPTAFTPFDNFNDFLIGAFIFEDVGVTAYHGAAGLITAAGDTNGTLAAAAGILAVEAYHAAYVRTAITGIDIAGGAANLINIANMVSDLRASLGGGNETRLTFPTASGNGTAAFTSTPSSIVAADSKNAIAFARTTDQVHHIVYGSATVGASKGGFFPAGTNSVFSVTTT